MSSFETPKIKKEIKRLKKAKEKIWGPEESGLKRSQIEAEYRQIESFFMDYYEKKISAKELADNLGTKILGINGEHAPSQIYAFDCLAKSLAYTKKEKNIDTIAEEMLFDLALEKHPLKREYLLGILAYYSNRERLENLAEEIENNPGNIQAKEEMDIILKINNSVARLDKKICYSEEMHRLIDYIRKSFPRENEECQKARLVSFYYGSIEIDRKTKEKLSPTKLPELSRVPRTTVIDPRKFGKRIKGSGIPRYIYVLPPSYHPSWEKLKEADEYGVELSPQAAVFEGEEKIFVEYDINPRLSRLYNRRIRYYKGKAAYFQAKGNKEEARKYFKRLKTLENALKERIWRALDSEAKRIFKDKNRLVVLKRTIRDYPKEEAVPGVLKDVLEKKAA